TRSYGDWSSDVCSSDLVGHRAFDRVAHLECRLEATLGIERECLVHDLPHLLRNVVRQGRRRVLLREELERLHLVAAFEGVPPGRSEERRVGKEGAARWS